MSLKKLLFIISSAIIFTSRFWGKNTSYNIRYALMLIWSLYFVMSYFSFHEMNEKKKIIRSNFFLVVAPFFAFFAYTLFLWLGESGVSFANYTRLCSTFLHLILAYGYACTAIYLFREKGINHLFWAGVCSYVFGSVLYLIFSFGLSGLNSYVRTLILGEESIANYAMEVHDLTFAMGIFFLYYLFFENKFERHHKTKIVVSVILILLGLKRIEILALCIATIVYILLLKRGKRINIRASICAVCAVAICLIYVYAIKSGIITAIMMKYGIDDSGRLSYYIFSKSFYEFSGSYFGKGWTWFSRYFEQLYISGYRIDDYRIAASIHSDILVMFIEIGFVLFVLWVLYMFTARPIILAKQSGTLTGECVLLLTLYMFILYLTDNTLNYPDTQMLFLLAPMTVALKDKCNNNQDYLCSKL